MLYYNTCMSKARKNELLKYAATLAAKNGQRWTDMREDVYDALLSHDTPVTAYQLIDFLSQKNGKDLKPASIYRSLDALCGLGVVARIESLNAFRACRHPEHDHQHVFLVCNSCGNTDEIADQGISRKLMQDAAHHGFLTARQVLELHGACRSCQT